MKRCQIMAGLLLCLFAATVAGAKTAAEIPLWPFLYYSSAENQTDLEILWPAFDRKRTPDEDTWRLLLSGHSHRKGETVWDLIWPMWRVQHDEAGHAHSRFFPLFFGRGKVSRYILLFPEFWWTYEDERNHVCVIVPFCWGRDEPNDRFGGLLPIAFWRLEAKDRYRVYVFPLIHRRNGPTTSTTILFPLYWNMEHTLLIVPIYGRGEAREKWKTYLPPLYVHRTTVEGYREHCFLWPFAAYGRGGHHDRYRFFPLFNYDRTSDSRQRDLLWPLYEWRESGDGRKQLRAGTFLIFSGDWYKGSSEIHGLTFFWNIQRERRHSQGFWPVYSYKRHEKGSVNTSFLDPLWFWGEATGEEEHVSALFKIFDYRRQPNGDSRFSFIWRAYRRDKRGGNVSWETFPFMTGEKSPERSQFSFGWRLFQYERSDGKRSVRLFFSPKIPLGPSGK